MIAFVLAFALSQIDPIVTQRTIHQTICVNHYTEGVRSVSRAERRTLYAGVPVARRRSYIVDHRISLGLGGSNDISNLQLQTRHESYVKDGLEKHLNHEVCAGRISLKAAQTMINDWRPE